MTDLGHGIPSRLAGAVPLLTAARFGISLEGSDETARHLGDRFLDGHALHQEID
jgi:hypothetical protein